MSRQAVDKFTIQERRAGALLAEHPGDPDTFEIEKLSPVAINMIRQRLADAKEEAKQWEQ